MMEICYIKNQDGFVFDEVSQTLVPYKFEAAIVDFANEKITHKCIIDGVSKEVEGNFDAYLNEGEFKKKNPYRGTEWSLQEIVDRVYGCCLTGESLAYAFVDGEAKLADVSIVEFMYQNGEGWSASNGERFYGTPQRVYDFHDYKVKDEDGTIRVVESPASKLALTEAQMTAVRNFEALYEKMLEMDIMMYYDMEQGSMKFVNKKHINRTLWDERQNGMVCICGMGYDLSFGPITYNSYDYDLTVLLKD